MDRRWVALVLVMGVAGFSGCQGGADTQNVGSSTEVERAPALDVPERLAATSQRLGAWEAEERIRLVGLAGGRADDTPVESGRLFQLPLDASSPLQLWHVDNRSHQYGRLTILFDVRRAALFASWMKAGRPPVLAADLSDSDGSTPSDAVGLRHPSGAHILGYSSDLSYIGLSTEVSPPSRIEDIDVDATTWLIYGLLQSTSVESILTAYRDAFVGKAQEWYDAGWISFEAITRFKNDLWQDSTLNHTGHLHVNTGQRDGLFASPRNDYYRCYRATTGSYGTIWSKASC
jgi:hypothetical protein